MPCEFPELPVLQGEVITRLSDSDFFELCQVNELLWFERNADRTITISPPAGAAASELFGEIHAQLFGWNCPARPGHVYGSSAGFRLDNGAIRAPDAAWLSRARRLVAQTVGGFLATCPEFVVEVLSPSDRLSVTQARMEEYLANGALLGFLLDVPAETAYVYRPGQPVQVVQGYDQSLSGEPILPGFALDLRPLRRG